ncbi:hypothetical protein Micbo1qcDRAFT_129118 [Microdochium bolleyi]|uniref:C2H2-type domain-containing protein n=1 Tax=Microdochium bolleyi TaxID=196109 RepID=A0A136IIV4_9PEZI|nr:hypothetical protein Micbo1qcDRAFT_129118 [Microdochium bolleyi]
MGTTVCEPCDRTFINEDGLRQHNQSKHSRLFCARCDQYFPSRGARQQHISNSDRHHVCVKCPHKPDFESLNGLDGHLTEIHVYCRPCKKHFGKKDDLTKHDIAVHYLCQSCGQYYNSSNELKNHLITHRDKTIECASCYAKFVLNSAMVLHLEAGTCPSGTNSASVDDIAFRCSQAYHYTTEDGSDFDYTCPSCPAEFSYISGLLQHAESDACAASLGQRQPLGRFLHFLRGQV